MNLAYQSKIRSYKAEIQFANHVLKGRIHSPYENIVT